MAITINTNVTSLIAQRNLSKAQSNLADSMERLSSGLRINSARDDAAGLAISNLMETKISALQQGTRNANDGVSAIQIAEGILNEVDGNLRRMHDLAVQAANGPYDDDNRTSLELEFSTLRDEIDRVAEKTEFNGTKLTNGDNSNLVIQIGGNNSSNDRLSVKLINAKSSSLGISNNSINTVSTARTSISSIENAINKLSDAQASLGADENRLNTAIQSNLNEIENTATANSRIKDLDFAEEVSSMTKNKVLAEAGLSMLAQANLMPQFALSLINQYSN